MSLGGSYQIGKEEIAKLLISKLPGNAKILDVGSGCGTYAYYLNGHGYSMEAVEIWKESLDYLQSSGLYDRVYSCDIRNFKYDYDYDLAIFGDVIEHLPVEDAQRVLKEAELHSKSVLVAVPYKYEQGALGGNEHEIHIQPDLTFDIFNERYPGYFLLYGTNDYGYFYKKIDNSEDVMKNKVCVYAICKNELKFVDKWLDNMSKADYIVVLDTGSTDGTYKKLREDPRVTKVVQKKIDPWRFDVARNESMKLCPEDANILVCTDFDELFSNKNWVETVKKNWIDGITNRMFYKYAWSHAANGEPTDVFMYDKIHTREMHWVFPVHEVLKPVDEEKYIQVPVTLDESVYLHHYQDKEKSRKSYEPLLELAVEENPHDPHEKMMLAREYFINNKYDDALKLYLEVIDMPEINKPEFRIVLLESLGRCADLYKIKENYDEAIWYCHEFIKEDPTYREPYFILAEMFCDMKMYTLAKSVAEAGFKYSVRKYNWSERAPSWTNWGYESIAIADYFMGNYKEAKENFEKVLEYNPDDTTSLKNFYLCCKELEKIENNSSMNKCV